MLLLAVAGYGQVLYGSLLGSVEDATGSVIPNADVTITNKETGLQRMVKTDDSGRYSFVNVPLGAYDLKVSANGFKTITKKDVDITANTVVRENVRLEVGQVADQVTVEAAASTLQTEKADVKSEISQKLVQNTPLNIYRNYQALINLVPGATPAGFQNSATDTPGRALTTNVNGTARNNNNTRIDGSQSVNVWLPHHTSYTAPAETVEQVNVSTGSFDAEQGMAGGAAITVITSSGSNQLRGAAWWYHNNQHLRSRNFFLAPSQNKPRDTLNMMGAKIGGPIIKNKLFFFGHYEATRQRVGNNGLFSVPTDAVRQGNFAGLATIYDPNSSADPRQRTPFANNTIPAARISPQTARVLSLVPRPNLPGQINNFAAGATGIFDRDNWDAKLNWNRNEKHTVFGKISILDAGVTGVGAFGQLVGPSVVQDPGTGSTRVYVPSIGTNWTISPTFLMDATWGASIMDQTVLAVDYGKNFGLETFGIPGTNGPDIRQSGLPAFNFTGYSSYGLTATWMPLFRNDRSYTFTTNFTKLLKSHEIRFGYDMINHQLNHWQPEIANPRGNFDFGGSVTALDGGASPNQFNSYAGFLLGLPTSMSKSLQNILMTGREWQHGFYVRDRWQVNRRLTVNLGLRYEFYPLMTRADGKGLEKVALNTLNVSLGGYGNVPRDNGISVSRALFAPRLGIAYRVNDNTVIRAGYGLTYDPLPFSRPLRGFFPLTIAGSFVAPAFQPAGSLSTGIPAIATPDLSTGNVPLPNTVDMRTPGDRINRGYIQTWNFTVERKFWGDTVVSAGYVGSQTTNQLADRNLNTAGPGSDVTGIPFAVRFGRRIALNYWDGWLSSNYHSLQVSFKRTVSRGLFFQGAYTWSRAMNMTDENGWAGTSFNWDPVIRRNYAPAGFDRTHMLQSAFIYTLPFGKGQKYAQNGVASHLLGGWQINTVMYAFTGTPFTATADAAILRSPGNLQTANQVGEVRRLGGVGPGNPFYDPASFQPVLVANTFGTMGRNALRGPGVIGMDAGLFRQFSMTERLNLQFRAEAFNFTNTPRFANPAANASNRANFMWITGTRFDSDRQFRFGLRLAF
jgi:outer membrane receptor protein involved in Fe transport